MNVEIRKVANGYMVVPAFNVREPRILEDAQVFVFKDYPSLCDKLQEILERPEPK